MRHGPKPLHEHPRPALDAASREFYRKTRPRPPTAPLLGEGRSLIPLRLRLRKDDVQEDGRQCRRGHARAEYDPKLVREMGEQIGPEGDAKPQPERHGQDDAVPSVELHLFEVRDTADRDHPEHQDPGPAEHRAGHDRDQSAYLGEDAGNHQDDPGQSHDKPARNPRQGDDADFLF